jgi:hypothetical protein
MSLTNICDKQCVDITFAEPGDPRIAHVNETNCFNSSDIGFAEVFTLTLKEAGQGEGSKLSAAARGGALAHWGYLPVVLGGLWALL